MKIDFIVQRNAVSVESVLRENGVSRRLITKLKRTENGITLNGRHTRTVDLAGKSDRITICLPAQKTLDAADTLCVPIIYEDENFIIFNKPAFMPVHPSVKHQGDTLGNFFSHHCKGLTFRPINRLDRDTSGLCCVAKDAYSARKLQHTISKVYCAIVSGEIKEGGTIYLPIAREKESIIKRCIRNDGQEAVTHYSPVMYRNGCTLLDIRLETGRTHQIRVHFSAIGYPLMGDELYGGDRSLIHRQALHCRKLTLRHPVTDTEMKFEADIPSDMASLIK